MLIQTAISLSGFYTETQGIPPRFIFLAPPAILFVVLIVILPSTRSHLATWNRDWLIAISLVRIPVEISLFLLFVGGAVPQIMTFKGSNFDILSGISAGILLLWFYRWGKPNRVLMFIWNSVCLFLLLLIVYHAVLSVPTTFQLYGFEQPNIAVLYTPFTLLPAYIVPVVLLSHLLLFRKVDNP